MNPTFIAGIKTYLATARHWLIFFVRYPNIIELIAAATIHGAHELQ
jgi:hypothetical protein